MMNNKGFTLIELLVAASILVLIATIVLDFVRTGFEATRYESEQAEAVKNSRSALSDITREVRGANSSEQGGYAINTIDAEEFIFFSDINDDGETERVRYYLAGTRLIKDVNLSGSDNAYNTATTTTVIADYINNDTEDIFRFYDSSYAETDIISNVRLIKVVLKINVTPEIAPADVYVETDVTLRNLKSNL